MRNDDPGFKEKSPCNIDIMTVPEFLTCPRCGEEVELWTDEDETLCPLCLYRLFRKECIIH